MPHQIQINFEHFVKTHFVIPLALFVVAIAGLEFTSLDFQISENFYNTKLHEWPYKEDWLIETVIHKKGQAFSKIMGGVVLSFLLFSQRKNSSLYRYRKSLLFLFIASITGPIITAILKSNTTIYCPWDLKLFGGEKPYIRLFDNVPGEHAIGHCFPSGHAGGGFTFISLYFFLMVVNPKYKILGLFGGLLLGTVYGIAQQMRGAHFLSHDIYALMVCWFSSLTWFLIFFRKDLQRTDMMIIKSSSNKQISDEV